ncbi:replication fork protection complex subunit TIPIN/Csm3/Swi3, partial [Phenoliferia sp. Uapishka_3]
MLFFIQTSGSSMSSGSDSDDSDVQAVRRHRANPRPLFRSELSSPVASSPPRPAAKRAQPRFLGDDNSPPPVDQQHDDLFSDLDDIPNARVPRAIDNAAYERLKNAPAGGAADDDFGFGRDAGDVDNVFGGDGEDVDGVKQKKKRVVAKMDDERLLGPNGFPKLLEEAKKFRTRGKGNEVKDLKRLMSVYQLWAHQMYPRTNLRDTLQSVERLCHKRRVHHALKGYRDDSKAEARKILNPTESDDEAAGNLILTSADKGKGKEKEKTPANDDAGDDWGMDLGMDDGADEEAAMAELELEQSTSAPKRAPPKAARVFDDFDEDEAAMMEMEMEMEAARPSTSNSRPLPPPKRPIQQQQYPEDNFDEDEAEMMAELEMASSRPSAPANTTKPPPKSSSSAPKPPKTITIDSDDEFGFDDDEVIMVELDLTSAAVPAKTYAKPTAATMDEDEFMSFDDDDEALLAAMELALPEKALNGKETQAGTENDAEEAMLAELGMAGGGAEVSIGKEVEAVIDGERRAEVEVSGGLLSGGIDGEDAVLAEPDGAAAKPQSEVSGGIEKETPLEKEPVTDLEVAGTTAEFDEEEAMLAELDAAAKEVDPPSVAGEVETGEA